MWITLFPEEVEYCQAIGQLRNDEAIAMGLKDRNDIDAMTGGDYNKKLHIQKVGSIAEGILSRYLVDHVVDLGVNEFKRGKRDVLGYECRSRNIKGDDPALTVYKDANNNDIYILVLRQGMVGGQVVGWMYAHEAKQQQWWRDAYGNGHYAYHVPPEYLHHMSTLPITDEYAGYVRTLVH